MYLETDALLKVQNPNSWKDKLPFLPGFFLSLNKKGARRDVMWCWQVCDTGLPSSRRDKSQPQQ